MYVYLIPRLLNFEIENFLNSRISFRKFRSLVVSGSCMYMCIGVSGSEISKLLNLKLRIF